MTMRLSIISFAGMVRTLVAVGTERLASMLDASAFAAPLRAAVSSCGSATSVASTAGIAAVVGASAGIGWGFASTEVVRATGVLPVAGAGVSAVTIGMAAVGVGSMTGAL